MTDTPNGTTPPTQRAALACWLIERSRHGRAEWLQSVLHPDEWTTDANAAMKFETEANAHHWISRLGGPTYLGMAIPTDHVFIQVAPPGLTVPVSTDDSPPISLDSSSPLPRGEPTPVRQRLEEISKALEYPEAAQLAPMLRDDLRWLRDQLSDSRDRVAALERIIVTTQRMVIDKSEELRLAGASREKAERERDYWQGEAQRLLDTFSTSNHATGSGQT